MIISKDTKPIICIVLVNYNGWQDTLECIASLHLLSYSRFYIVIIDNNSTDNSVDHIKNWAAKVPVNTGPHAMVGQASQMSYAVTFKHITDAQIHAGKKFTVSEKEIVLISSKANLGFAGGNNLGTKFALHAAGFDYVWYLNNDTVADPNALSALVNYFGLNSFTKSRLGMVGSKLRYYQQPQVIQAIGGYYNKWFAYTKHVGANELDQGQYDSGQQLPRIDYVVGASMLVSQDFLQKVGFMNEAYFLYFEEIDWIIRGQALGFTFAYCPDSLVYHKEGKSTGGNSNQAEKSYIADFYSISNRLTITQKYFPQYLFLVYLSMVGAILNRIKRGQFSRVKMIVDIFLNSLFSSFRKK